MPHNGEGNLCSYVFICGSSHLLTSVRLILTKSISSGRQLFHACALMTIVSLTTIPAQAVEPSERLTDPAMEARARTISGELRCLVCQNESIDESGADLAHDIRIFVRQRLTAGDSNARVIQSVVSRYGTFVLLKPPIEPATYVLWYGPPALVLTGLAGTLVWLKRRRPEPRDTAPLTPEETTRLAGLMRENDA